MAPEDQADQAHSLSKNSKKYDFSECKSDGVCAFGIKINQRKNGFSSKEYHGSR